MEHLNRNVSLRMLVFLLIAALLLTPNFQVIAASAGGKAISLQVDGKISKPSVAPQMVDKTVYVPLKHVTQIWNANVSWNNKAKQVSIVKDGNSYLLTLNSKNALKNKRPMLMTAPVRIIKNTTMVPVRFIAEAFGAKVDWNATKALVTIANFSEQLPLVGSYENLKKILVKQYENANQANGVSGMAMPLMAKTTSAVPMAMADAAPAPAAPPAPSAPAARESANSSADASASSGASDFSKTNVQVEGVDEADVVKTDGKFIYQVRKNQITISQAYPAEAMKVVGNLTFDGEQNFSPREIYVDGNTLVVIGTGYEQELIKPATKPAPGCVPPVEPQVEIMPEVSTPEAAPVADAATPAVASKMIAPCYDYGPIYDYRDIVKALVFDMRDKAKLKLQREFKFDGYYVSSRKIDNHLYLIANKYIYYSPWSGSGDVVPAPRYEDSSVADKWLNVNFSEIRYFPDSTSQQYLMVAGIDVKDAAKDANVSTYLGAGENVYASTKNLYVTMNKYEYKKQPVTPVESVTPAQPLAPATKEAEVSESAPESASSEPAVGMPLIAVDPFPGRIGFIWSPPDVTSVIYKFSLDQGIVSFIAKGSAPGSVLNQFSMDEHNGYFRIATTKGEVWGSGENQSKNNLYVLDGQLNMTGKLEGIAPGEKIYSVRFMGNRAYMVTFKTVDPLFVIDVANPAAPKILGELKIPGYSDYLHPYDENHLIGIGKDAVESGNMAFQKGLKIALFDVTDVNKPKEKFTETIGDRGTDSELLRNHKALLFSKERNLFALPVTLHEITKPDPQAGDWQYGEFTFQGAYIYSLDLEKGFKLRTRISHFAEAELAEAKANWSYYDHPANISRILYLDESLYTVSNKKIQANELNTLTFQNDLLLP